MTQVSGAPLGARPVDYDPFLLDHVAQQGNGADRYLAHMSPGDLVIPEEHVTPEIKALHGQMLGRLADRFTVGHPQNSINQKTGLIQFEGDGGDGGDGGGSGQGAGSGGGGGPGGQGGADGSGSGASGGQAAGSGGSVGGGAGGMGVGGGDASGGANASDPGTAAAAGSDTSVGNELGNMAQHTFTGVQAMMAGVNPPDVMGALAGIGTGMLTGGIPGAIMGGFTGAAGVGLGGKVADLARSADFSGGGQSTNNNNQGAGGGAQGPFGGPINSLTTTQGPTSIQAGIAQGQINPLLQNLLLGANGVNPYGDQSRPAQVGNPYITGNQGRTA